MTASCAPTIDGSTGGGTTVISFHLGDGTHKLTPGVYRVEFFGNPASDTTEGRDYFGFVDVTVPAQGFTNTGLTFTTTTANIPVSDTTFTATATQHSAPNVFGDTSMFSTPSPVPAPRRAVPRLRLRLRLLPLRRS